MLPGLRLRQVREHLGLTYRDVERSSYEIAAKRGRPEFILHISRLADIENRNVVPGLHKLYALAVVYHLNPVEIFRWYEVPVDEFFADGAMFPAPQTHLGAPPATLRVPLRFDPAFDPRRTEYLSRMVEEWSNFEGTLLSSGSSQYRYGYIGLTDQRMLPLLRPGSIVMLDTSVHRIQDIEWSTEYDRPLFFVEVRAGYRCGWFHQDGQRLVMQPHPLSRCLPEWWRMPEEAEIIGRVIGIVTRLNEPWNTLLGVFPAERADSSRKAP
jgi:transcriptional regulator with XRE-family HTH domain